MIKKNKNGFALAETIIVSVFVVSIFTIIYVNFFPIMGEYEKREGYDNVDSIYNTYAIKKMYEKGYNYGSFSGPKVGVGTNYACNLFNYTAGYGPSNIINKDDVKNKCNSAGVIFKDEGKYCSNLLKEMKVVSIYLTKYNLTDLQSHINDTAVVNVFKNKNDEDIIEYINTLPHFRRQYSSKEYEYRIIVKYITEINKESTEGYKKVYNYSTIGVDI